MLKWIFGADTSPFRRSLNEMRNDVKGFAADAKSQLAGLFGAGAITAWVKSTLDAAGRIDDLSKRLDMSAESFQRVSYASKLSGGDMEVVGRSLTILTKNLAEATSGSDKFDEAAKALGLNLGELAGMNPEGQLVELARGYSESANKGEALNAVIKLLGKSGAEIIPMLKDGPEALTELLGEATVASNAQIATLAKIGDEMDALKSKSVAALGTIIDGFKVWGAYAEFVINKIKGKADAGDILGGRIDEIAHGDSAALARKNKSDEAEAGAKEQAKLAKERKDLEEDIVKMEEESRLRSLSLTEKILDAEKRRAALAAEALFGDDETKALEARKSQLEVEKEIAGYRKDQKDEDDKAKALKDKTTQDLKSLMEKGAQIERANKLAGMSERERREFLKREREDARKKAREAYDSGDTKGALEAGNKINELTGQIDEITRGIRGDLENKLADARKAVPTIATSSLADIGGGGGARLMDNDQQRRIVDLLAQIASNTAGGSDGSRPPEPIT